ncbi:MAG TPA: anaerobic ribonucleoside-triphosphate reductase [archaeon]|nr:anaerobic ribonucleoside-triphosphate reductase [archaeon]
MKCNKETEVFSRVTGFYRPTKLWNKGKKEEFKERKTYSINKYNIINTDKY